MNQRQKPISYSFSALRQLIISSSLTRESKRLVPNFDILLFKKYLWDNIRGSQRFGTIIHND